MSAILKNPLSGRPRTEETLDATKMPVFLVSPWVLTPFCAWINDGLKTGWAVIMTLFFADVMLGLPAWDETVITHAVLPCGAGYLALVFLTEMALRRRTRIAMTTGAISVKRLTGWKHYNRNLGHQFYLQIHDKAQDEYRKNTFEIQQTSAKGKLIQKKAYYGESFHVVLSYGGHRHDLLTVYGEKDAVAIIARLQFCDRRLNESVGMGGGVSQEPADDWNDGPGGLNRE